MNGCSSPWRCRRFLGLDIGTQSVKGQVMEEEALTEIAVYAMGRCTTCPVDTLCNGFLAGWPGLTFYACNRAAIDHF